MLSNFIDRDNVTLTSRDMEDYAKPNLNADHCVIFKQIQKRIDSGS